MLTFNRAILHDFLRVGRPLTYDESQLGAIVKVAKTKPQQLGLEFGHWTLNLLVEYTNQEPSNAISGNVHYWV